MKTQGDFLAFGAPLKQMFVGKPAFIEESARSKPPMRAEVKWRSSLAGRAHTRIIIMPGMALRGKAFFQEFWSDVESEEEQKTEKSASALTHPFRGISP
jgi:hypothetical protein